MKRHWIVLAVAACSLLAAGGRSSALAGDVGNELTARAAASDGATEVFYSNFFAAPYAGEVSGINLFFQNQGAINTFHVYQLRPTGTPNQFNVVYDSGLMAPSGAPNSASTIAFTNGSTNAQPGDIFAHYGRGIPYSDAGQLNANQLQAIYYPTLVAPIAGNPPITLGSAAFPKNNGFIRDYASSVTMSSFIEQVGFGTVNRASIDGASGIVGVLRNDPFTEEGTVTKWHIYSDDTVANNRSITPLILRETVPGTYQVVGEGAPKVNAVTGLQMFDFDLVSGTAEVLAGDMVGWWDGSGGTANLGVAEWDGFGAETIPLWLDADGIGVGDVFSPATAGFLGAGFARQYSINFTTTPAAVPEPAAIAGWIIVGACGIAFAWRRRRTK